MTQGTFAYLMGVLTGLFIVFFYTFANINKRKKMAAEKHAITDYATLLHASGMRCVNGETIRKLSGKTFQLNAEETKTFFTSFAPPVREMLGLKGNERVLYLGRVKSEYGGHENKDHRYAIFQIVFMLNDEPRIDQTPFSPKNHEVERIAEKYDALASTE